MQLIEPCAVLNVMIVALSVYLREFVHLFVVLLETIEYVCFPKGDILLVDLSVVLSNVGNVLNQVIVFGIDSLDLHSSFLNLLV